MHPISSTGKTTTSALKREPVLIGEQPDSDLRLQPPLLREPRLPEPVPGIGLEIQGGHVEEHQARRSQPGMGGAARGDLLPPGALRHAYTGRRRFRVRQDAAATPASPSTRSESSLLTGSMIRASTRSRNTSSPPLARSKPSTAKACDRASSRQSIRDAVIGSGPPPVLSRPAPGPGQARPAHFTNHE